MTIVLFVLVLVAFGFLVGIAAVVPNVAAISLFELERRKKKGDKAIALDLLREEMLRDVVSIQRALTALLLVLFVILCVATFGTIVGIFVAVIVALEYGAIARLNVVRSRSQKIYDKYELQILEILNKYQSVTKWFRSVVPQDREVRVNSKDELEDLVNQSRNVLSDNEKIQILSSLQFEEKTVQTVMTPKSVVDTIPRHEILGPLVLDGLHKTGHSRFPVTNGDIDHVVGILHLRDVLTIDSHKKHTARVESAMSKSVFYIRQDHTLSQALSAFLRTHHHLFIVINEFRETVGIITLEDTLEALLGRSIIDEFDAHDDMRAVASRQAAKKTNQTTEAIEV